MSSWYIKNDRDPTSWVPSSTWDTDERFGKHELAEVVKERLVLRAKTTRPQ